jgi:rhamnosyltransferase
MRVSIVLPVRNAGPDLEGVLAGIAAQRHELGEVELLAVDSGSTDGTPERLERAGARVLRIAPETFDHGGTRDLAISEARGELVVLLVQDATPGDERWLANLVAEFDDPEVAGAWCRQVARPDAPSVTALRLAESLHGSRKRRLARLPPGRKLADLDPFDRLALCSFDNVCSAVRKSVWRSIRFGPCAFAEDMIWGKTAIEAGHALAYTSDAFVVHSHDRSIAYEYRRTYLAHHALHHLFGVRTVPDLATAWRSLATSGPWMRHAWTHDRPFSRRLHHTLRVPAERFVTAIAQLRGARDASQGKPPRRMRGV